MTSAAGTQQEPGDESGHQAGDEPRISVLSRAEYSRLLHERFPRERRPWFWRVLRIQPRAFHSRGTVYVRRGHERAARLLAHEYGHFLGLRHPSPLSPWYWLDVTGFGLRVTDRHDLLERSSKWRRRARRQAQAGPR